MVSRINVEVEFAFDPKLVAGVNGKMPVHVPFTEKQPAATLSPPLPTREEVAVVKFAVPPIEKREPGVVVAIPTKEFGVIARVGTDEVAKVVGEEVAK